MDHKVAKDALYSANILTEVYKSNVGDNPWIQANPEIAIAVERAVLAMEEACEAIRQKQSEDQRGTDSEQHLRG